MPLKLIGGRAPGLDIPVLRWPKKSNLLSYYPLNQAGSNSILGGNVTYRSRDALYPYSFFEAEALTWISLASVDRRRPNFVCRFRLLLQAAIPIPKALKLMSPEIFISLKLIRGRCPDLDISVLSLPKNAKLLSNDSLNQGGSHTNYERNVTYMSFDVCMYFAGWAVNLAPVV